MVCPACGEDDEMSVAVTIMAALREDGTDAEGDHEWDDDSACECGCGWSGKVADAKAGLQEFYALPDHCEIEGHPTLGGYRYVFGKGSDDLPVSFPTWLEAVRAAAAL